MASSVMDSNNFLFVLFSVEMFIRLNEMLSCLSKIISFYAHVSVTKVAMRYLQELKWES